MSQAVGTWVEHRSGAWRMQINLLMKANRRFATNVQKPASVPASIDMIPADASMSEQVHAEPLFNICIELFWHPFQPLSKFDITFAVSCQMFHRTWTPVFVTSWQTQQSLRLHSLNNIVPACSQLSSIKKSHADLLELIQKQNESMAKQGSKIDFLLKKSNDSSSSADLLALEGHPIFDSSLSTDADQIVLRGADWYELLNTSSVVGFHNKNTNTWNKQSRTTTINRQIWWWLIVVVYCHRSSWKTT